MQRILLKDKGLYWLRAIATTILSIGVAVDAVAAQSTPPAACQPPKVGEFLVLVRSPSPTSQDKVKRALPANTNTIVCRYLKDTVTRTGSFTKIENANAQADYLKKTVGLPVFVVRSNPQKTPTPTAYNPKPLGTGYAVLVDYFNRPEIAQQVQQVVGSNIGLISYGQRPYLLAMYTSEQPKANATLQKLSERGFFAMLVDSRKVILLSSQVKL